MAQSDTGAEVSGTAAAVDTGDWDWGGFAPMDDTPKAKSHGSRTSEESPGAAVAKVRPGPTTGPDFAQEPSAVYPLFPGIPTFKVIASLRDADMHPCRNCHAWTTSDPTPRPLKPPHDNFALKHGLHGKGSFWCFTCHSLEGNGGLRTFEDQPLDFSEAYVLCSQCHVKQARDWAFGAHGKRVGSWQGERQVYNCTVCHYQHHPAIEPRVSMPGPEVRQGLERPAHWVPREQRQDRSFESEPLWQRHAADTSAEEKP